MIPRRSLILFRFTKSSSILTTFQCGDSTYHCNNNGSNRQPALARSFSLSPPFLQKESLITILRNDVNAYKNVSKDLIHKKYSDAYSFYEQFSHMDEVREAHDKVIAIQVQ